MRAGESDDYECFRQMQASWRQDILSCQEQGTSQVFGGGGGHRIVQRVGHEWVNFPASGKVEELKMGKRSLANVKMFNTSRLEIS